MNHSKPVISGLTIAHVIAAYPSIIAEFPFITSDIEEMKVMRFELFDGYRFPAIVPNIKIIQQLIYFPDNDLGDPYHLNKYRVRPQVSHPESEKLLVFVSNLLVDKLDNKRLNPSPFDLALSKWCHKHGIDYELVNYFQNVITYCRLILPVSSPNPDTDSKIHKALKDVFFLDKKVNMLDELRQRSGIPSNVDEAIERDYYLSCRFPEYDRAIYQICQMEQQPAYTEMRKAHLDDANRINADVRTNEKARRTGSETGVLSQCMFCYRFHTQDTRSRNRLSKCCSDCKGSFDTWTTFLRLKGEFKQSEVYRDGFYRYPKP